MTLEEVANKNLTVKQTESSEQIAVRDNKTNVKKQCEICGKGRIVVWCQYCGKGLCTKCYGTWRIPRKCCGREPWI